MDAGTVYSIDEAMRDLESNKEKIRSKAFEFLLPVSEKHPERLYAEWDRFVALLKKEEVSNKYVAIHLLANLVAIDRENKFERIFEDFYQLLNHESPVVSLHIAGKSGKIINARPGLRRRIIEKLLSTDETNQCRHPELLKSYVIDALDECFVTIENKDEIIRYVREQCSSESPKTKKRAKAFLKKHVL